MALSWKLDPFAMIPYWPPFYVRLGPFTISPPIALACAGILVAHFLLLRRVGRQGLDRETAAMMSLVMVVAGAFGAYWFRGVYQADAVKRDWHTLLQFQYGAASFGGSWSGTIIWEARALSSPDWSRVALFRRLRRAFGRYGSSVPRP